MSLCFVAGEKRDAADAVGHACGVRVDGAAPRGLWPPAGGGLCSLRSGGDSACGAEGGGIALSGDEYKVSVTGFTFCVI